MANYDEDYYERGRELGISGYSSYRWLPELTIPLAHEIVTQLGIRRGERILDFGCAKGYLVKALRLLHHEAWGTDVSEYALSKAPEDVQPFLSSASLITFERFDWIIAKDVLEHVPYEELPQLLSSLRSVGNNLFAIVPLGDGKKYVIPEYEGDVTHVIRENLGWWRRAFQKAGFVVKEATYLMPYIKANWDYAKHGNGFFILGR